MSIPLRLGPLRFPSLRIKAGRRRRGRRPACQPRIEPLEGRSLLASGPSASLVADIVPGPGSSNPGGLTAVGGTLYFGAEDSSNSPGLWKSDGTPAGTVLVKGGLDNAPWGFTPMNDGTVFFSTSDQIWKTDGTTAGTALVKSLRSVSNLTAVGGTLFLVGNDGATGGELWRSDGTTAGTTLVKDIYPGTTTYTYDKQKQTVPNSSSPSWLTGFKGMLYFGSNDGKDGVELWRSDGTAAGTVLVTDLAKGQQGSNPQYLTVMNGALYFGASGGLYKTDGTAAGMVKMKSFASDQNLVTASDLTVVDNTLFLAADDGTTGPELWKSDGTPAGTVLVRDILSSYGANPFDLASVNGTLYFGTSDPRGWTDPATAPGLWKSDGTAAGTVLVKAISVYGPGLTHVNGQVYFAADDGVHGDELWQSDGTTAGTAMVQDINPGGAGSTPSDLTAMNNKLYFVATDPAHGTELWDPPAVVGAPGGNLLVACANTNCAPRHAETTGGLAKPLVPENRSDLNESMGTVLGLHEGNLVAFTGLLGGTTTDSVLLSLASSTGAEATAYGWLIDIASTGDGVLTTVVHQGKGSKTNRLTMRMA